MGAFLTFLLMLITIMFSYTKLVSLMDKQEVDIMSALSEGAIAPREKFSAEDGFYVAAALTEYDTNTEIIEEARYGELIIEHYGWGNDQYISGS